MKKLILALILLSFIVSGCQSFRGEVVGKDISNVSVDVRLDNGDVRKVSLTRKQFYSGDFEVGDEVDISCMNYNCAAE